MDFQKLFLRLLLCIRIDFRNFTTDYIVPIPVCRS